MGGVSRRDLDQDIDTLTAVTDVGTLVSGMSEQRVPATQHVSVGGSCAEISCATNENSFPIRRYITEHVISTHRWGITGGLVRSRPVLNCGPPGSSWVENRDFRS